jgi:hypothetical protein
MFKSDPLLIRQKWLKPETNLQTIVKPISFKCDDPAVKTQLTSSLDARKETFISAPKSKEELLKEISKPEVQEGNINNAY